MNEKYSLVRKDDPPKPILFYIFNLERAKMLNRLESLGYKYSNNYAKDLILSSSNLKGIIINDPNRGIGYISGFYKGDLIDTFTFGIGSLDGLFNSMMYINTYNTEFQSNISKSKGLLL